MLKHITLALSTMILASFACAEASKKDNVQMFPKAQAGFVRHVIEVPKTDNDYDHKVELLIGKIMLVDCNKHALKGKIERVILKGWGYHYLEVSNIHNGSATLMACQGDKTEKFIQIHSAQNSLQRYNSLLPIVIYAPEGYEVRYRIWSANETVQKAKQR